MAQLDEVRSRHSVRLLWRDNRRSWRAAASTNLQAGDGASAVPCSRGNLDSWLCTCGLTDSARPGRLGSSPARLVIVFPSDRAGCGDHPAAALASKSRLQPPRSRGRVSSEGGRCLIALDGTRPVEPDRVVANLASLHVLFPSVSSTGGPSCAGVSRRSAARRRCLAGADLRRVGRGGRGAGFARGTPVRRSRRRGSPTRRRRRVR